MRTTRRMNPNLKPWMNPSPKLTLWMNPKMKPSPKLNPRMNPKLNLRINPSSKLNPRKNLKLSLNLKLRLTPSLPPRLAGASFAGCGLCSGLRQGMCL